MMIVKVVLLCVVFLSVSWACSAGEEVQVTFLSDTDLLSRNAVISDDISAFPVKEEQQEKGIHASDEVVKNEQICTLCEEFAGQALDYLHNNKTEVEIIDILHKSCSRLRVFEEECVTLVDYYAPLFFKQISLLEPHDFCVKLDLCQKIVSFSSELLKDSCTLCHRALSDIIIKLKDPDTQLEIIEDLLKLCNSMDNYAQKCKKLVFQFGPLILTNVEHFLEKTDICTLLHACSKEGATELKADS